MRLWLDTEEDVDLKAVNLLDAHRSLNSFFVQLAMYDLVCETNLGLIQRLLACCDVDRPEPGADPAGLGGTIRHLEFLRSWYEGMQARSTFITRRVETQLQTVRPFESNSGARC